MYVLHEWVDAKMFASAHLSSVVAAINRDGHHCMPPQSWHYVKLNVAWHLMFICSLTRMIAAALMTTTMICRSCLPWLTSLRLSPVVHRTLLSPPPQSHLATVLCRSLPVTASPPGVSRLQSTATLDCTASAKHPTIRQSMLLLHWSVTEFTNWLTVITFK